MARRKARMARPKPSPPDLHFTGQEIGVLLRALSLFEHAFKHDPRERHIISRLKQKLHERLASEGVS